jgi:hypothetical protein
MRQTFQYLSITTKLAWTFESIDDAMQLVFRDMMSFPQSAQQFFPKIRFEIVLQHLSRQQKQLILQSEIGLYQASRVQANLSNPNSEMEH